MNIQFRLKINTRLPRLALVIADSLLFYQENRHLLYKGKPFSKKVFLFLFDMACYVFAKVYLFFLTIYVYFCVKILKLPDEYIYPPYNGGKL
jgi:hypothetical protein